MNFLCAKRRRRSEVSMFCLGIMIVRTAETCAEGFFGGRARAEDSWDV